jgi:ParB-like chromosome segregation protein Spo0J
MNLYHVHLSNLSDPNNNKNNRQNSSTTRRFVSTKKEYLNIIPPLSEAGFALLKQSIKDKGLLIPIIVNKDGIVLDGNHRFRACKELGIPLQFQTKELKDSLDEKELVIELHLRRRQLNEYQRVELGYSLEVLEKARAKRRMSLGGHIAGLANKKEDDDNNNEVGQRGASIDATLEPCEEKGKVSKIIARKIGVSAATYERGKKIIEKGTENQKNNLRKDTIGITSVYNQIRRQEQKEDLIRQVQEAGASGSQPDKEIAARVNLIQGDFQYIDTTAIGDKSIDLIFTDPPYHKEWLPMYEPLGKLACRVLKQGGSLVMYAGHYALPEIFDYMKNSGLKYWWEMVVKHNGSSRLLQYQRVYVMWTPLLWFVKGNRLKTLDSMADLIESGPPAKSLHNWKHSSVEAEHVISKLTIQDDIVLDPIMGIGTTGIAALRLNRRFIGIEKEQGTFELAKERIDLELSDQGTN